ncbi:sulfatase [Verrucomicrobiaceae bacterium N1E253]|uniref:Sulfatase n=1 Tax=Oceaniferula marina TaxID=2748318 RepID=A0A851GNF0_9BACT|nr:sulfatase [Oceaniferula marina]NWK56655.1 sulfatase [Oceaniferula marina]
MKLFHRFSLSRSPFVSVGLRVSALSACVIFGSHALADSPKPNVLFVFSDDHACHSISAYGSKINKTPNIDRIAEAGALFENSFCANAICGPSRACVMSGKHSYANGFVSNWGKSFDGTQPTLMNALNKGGYQTALIGKWHLGDHPKDGYGIDHWELWGSGYHNPVFTDKQGRHKVKGYSTTVITDKAIRWMSQRDRAKPFVMMCTYNAPHRTWAVDPKHYDRYKGHQFPLPETLHDDWSNRSETLRANRQSIAEHFYYKYDLKVNEPVPFASAREKRLGAREYSRLSAEGKALWDAAYGPENLAFIKAAPKGRALVEWKYQRYIRDYVRCVDSVDENVGRLLDYLERDGILENTIVIYSSDQGFFLGDHGLYDKRWMFEEAFKMPFIISWPGKIKAGSRYQQFIQNIDYAPTLIDAAGLNVPDEMQGVSLLPVFDGATPEWRESVYYHFYEGGGEHNAPKHEGVRTARYKLIHFYTMGEYNLFDLEKDPNEMKDLSKNPEYRKVMDEMKDELERLRKQYGQPPLPSKKTGKKANR